MADAAHITAAPSAPTDGQIIVFSTPPTGSYCRAGVRYRVSAPRSPEGDAWGAGAARSGVSGGRCGSLGGGFGRPSHSRRMILPMAVSPSTMICTLIKWVLSERRVGNADVAAGFGINHARRMCS